MSSAYATSQPVGFRQRRQLRDARQAATQGTAGATPAPRSPSKPQCGVARVLPLRADAAEQAIAYSRRARARFVRELIEFIRFPSISAQPEHTQDIQHCAAWLAQHLRTIGLEHVEIVRTGGHPIVTADWLHATRPNTVLVYGHYDVQPPEPLDKWKSPPFEPAIRGDYLYGRGASDDKGQMFVHVKAIESYLQTIRSLPVNVKCLFEGEEEIGSPGLAAFIAEYRDSLAAEFAVVSDTRILASDRPALTYGLRGGLSVELEVAALRNDLHSGNFGGAVHNPVQALCDLLAGLHNVDGRIAIPGFYDRVRTVGVEERAYLQHVGPSDQEVLKSTGAAQGWGERGYTAYERTVIRPALTITGIAGGYTGSGVKAVIPACAAAKLNFRLVPDQEPHEIDRMFRAHVARVAPPTITTRIDTRLSARPALVRRNHPAMRAAANAYCSSFDVPPVFLRSGGTIPVVNILQETLGIPTVLMGFALPDDALHAPNERFYLPNFSRGFETGIHFLAELAKLDTGEALAAPFCGMPMRGAVAR